MPISNITRTNTVDEWRIQTNLSANALNKIETGNYDKTAGSLNIACTAVLSITSTGTGLSVANNALVSGDFTVGKSIALGSEGAATGNLTVGANVFIYGRGASLFVANSAIVNVSLQATESIRTNNFIANNDASITGTAQLGVLTVNTNATVGTTLAVVGNTTVGNLVTSNSVVGDNGRFSSNVVASHFVTVAGSLVADSARITSNATFGETTATTINATNARISGNANVAHVTASGSLVADNARIAANATFGETTATTINTTNARISGNANVAHVTASGSFVGDSARITANATFGETTASVINATNARISGNANVAHLTASASVVADSLRITNDVGIGTINGGTLRVTGNGVFGNVNTANMMYAGTLRTVGRTDVGGVLTVGSDASIAGKLTVSGDFVLSGDIVYDTDALTISTVTPVTDTGAAYFGVFRGSTTGGVTGGTGGAASTANAYIRWIASSNTWQIRDVFNADNATSYSKILTANLISSSLTSTSTDTFLSSSGAKSLKDSINTEISDREANVGAARIVVTNAYQANTGAARLELLANVGAARITDTASAQANTGAGLISVTNAYQANVGAARIADQATSQANTGAGLISVTNAYQANVGAARIADLATNQANVGSAIAQGQANVGAARIAVTNAYQANVGAARIEALNAVITANTNLKNYVDVAVAGKDNTDEITEGSTNLYFTNARARAAVSATGSLSYNSSTGVFSYTQGNTDTVAEGSTNLYFTNTRARAAVGVAATFGSPLNYISANGTFQHLNSGVTATNYGGAATVPVFTVNSTGHLSYAGNVAIAISSGAVSGLASSATTDTTNAGNISSGTLAVARGGTGLSSYTSGGVLYASGSGTLASSSSLYFDGTNFGVGTNSPSTYGKFAVLTTTSANTSLVSTSSSLTDKSVLEFRKTLSIGSTATNSIGRISWNSLQGSTATESAFINVYDYRVGGVSIPSIYIGSYNQTVGVVSSSLLISNNITLDTQGSISFDASTTTAQGDLNAVGDITAGYSDDRLKTKLGNIDFALAKVSKLNGFFYEPNSTAQELGYDARRQVGLSAQELQSVLPEAVVPAPVDNQYLTIQYEKVVPLLVEAIKELKAEIEELKKK